MKSKVATVAVDNTYFSFDTDYSYAIPDFLENTKPGCRVLVPFGRGNNERYGIVLSVSDGDTSSLKEISKIIDKPLSDEMIQLALWLKVRCFCTTYDCLKQMLPRRYGSLKIKSRKMVRIKDGIEHDSTLTKKQAGVFDLLSDITAAEVNEVCEFCSVGISVLKALEKISCLC